MNESCYPNTSVLMSSLSFIYAAGGTRGQSIREMNLFCCVCESKTRFADLLAAFKRLREKVLRARNRRFGTHFMVRKASLRIDASGF